MIIGITGGICSGKTSVIREIKKIFNTRKTNRIGIYNDFKLKFIDADKISHRIILKGTSEYKKILRIFGREILNKNKQINRKKLGKIIFGNLQKRKLLEKIMHPTIIKEIKTKINKYKNRGYNVILDAPLLYETNLTGIVDKVVVVWVSKKTQIKRLMERDKISYEEILMKINSQIPLDYKRKLADYVINNNKQFKFTKKQVKSIFTQILN